MRANPATIALGLLAAAGMLVGAILFALHMKGESPARPPFTAIAKDEQRDTLRVIAGETAGDWAGFELYTDGPVMASLVSDPLNGTLSPGGRFVELGIGSFVLGGDELHLCSMGLPGVQHVQLRDAASNTVVSSQEVELAACADGPENLLDRLAP